MSLRRLIAGVLALLAGVAALVVGLDPATGHVPPPPTNPCPGGTDAVLNDRAWTIIKQPEGLERITAHAAGGVDAKLVLATDGRKLRRSSDGGCTWFESYEIETPDAGSATPRIRALSYPGGGERAYMLVDGLAESAGSQLLRSDDAGKTWVEAGDGLPPVGGFRQIAGAGDDLYVVVSPPDAVADLDAVGVTGQLYALEEGTWRQRSSGGPIVSLGVDPSDPKHLFVVRADGGVLESGNGGQSFADVDIPASDDPDLQDTAADPEAAVNPRAKWRTVAVGRGSSGASAVALSASPTADAKPSRIAVSLDGGAHFADASVRGLSRVSAMTWGNDGAQLLVTSGSDAPSHPGPGLQILDVANGVFRDVDDEELFSLFEPGLIDLSVSVRGHEGLQALQMRSHFTGGDGQRPDVIARYTIPDPPPPASLPTRTSCAQQVADGIEQPSGGSGLRRDPGRVRFEPGLLSLKLEPGKPVTTSLKADVPRQAAALDVGFLFDTSTSMQKPITGVLCSIDQLAISLKERGIDARFGVAAFNDRFDYRYKRFQDLTSSSEKLRDTLTKVLLKGGNEEPMRTGLNQLATGAGFSFDDRQEGEVVAGETYEIRIPPNEGMNWDAERLHVAMVIGDEAYNEATPGEPTREEVVTGLKGKQVKTIGIQIRRPLTAPTEGANDAIEADRVRMRQQLEYFARETGTVAPAGGVDCDGGGQPDVAEGDPLVCTVSETGVEDTVGDTLVSLLRLFRERKQIRIVPSRTSGLDVRMQAADLPDADIRSDNVVAGATTISCTEQQAGKRYPLEFDLLVGDAKVGSLPGAATCGTLAAAAPAARSARPGPPADQPNDAPREAPAPAPKQPAPDAPSPAPATPAPAAQPTPQAAAAAAPPPPPPSPVPIASAAPSGAASSASASASASATASAPAASQAAVGQVGMAAAEERARQAQVATVHADGTGDHAMVALRSEARERSVLPAPAAITLGVGLLGCAGWLLVGPAYHRRRRFAPARVRR